MAKKRVLKFVVTGPSTYGVKNAGDDGMFSNLVEGLRREAPNCDIVFVCRHPDSHFDAVFQVRSVRNVDHDNKEQSQGRWFYGFNAGDDPCRLSAIRREIETCDAMIIGGNAFMEVSANDYLRGVASYAALFAQMAICLGKPYYLYGVAVHPAIRQEQTQQIARFVCSNARLVLLREEFSRHCLLEVGVPGSNLRVLGDPVFGSSAVVGKERGLRLLSEEGIHPRSEALVGVSFRLTYWNCTDEVAERQTTKMARLCDQIIKDLNVEILFVPNCTYDVDTHLEDDRYVARLVWDKMKYQEQTHQVRGEYLFPDILTLFPLLSMHLSNRRHSCINAAIHGVPFVALISGAPMHIRPFMEALEVPRQVADFQADGCSEIYALLEETWNNREPLTESIKGRLGGLRNLAHRYTTLIAEDLAGQRLACASK